MSLTFKYKYLPHNRIYISEADSITMELIRRYAVGKNNVTGSCCSLENNLINHLLLELPFTIPRSAQAGYAVQLPRGFDLRPHQEKDLEKIQGQHFVLNANRPGYGKTIEALVWAKNLVGERGRVLVVCPKSIKYQWQAACKQFGIFEDIEVDAWGEGGARSLITNYEQLYDSRRIAQVRGVPWNVVILDEIHKIRNPDLKTKKTGKPTITGIMKTIPAQYKMGLTGSPVYNRPDDIWSIGRWINPWYFGGSYWNFVNVFCEIKEDFWGRKPVGLSKDPMAVQLLQQALDCFMIRNPEVLEGLSVNTVPLVMYHRQEAMYGKIKRLLIEELDQESIKLTSALGQLTKLQQMTSNPELLVGSGGNPKFDWIMDFLENNPEEKIVVFSKFKETIKALDKFLDAKVVCARIYGEIGALQRQFEKDFFIQNKECRAILGTIGALGEGIDGLQKVCTQAIFIDRAWTWEANNQAMRRLHREGQKGFVHIWMLECIQTVDQKVGKTVLKKKEDIRRLLAND